MRLIQLYLFTSFLWFIESKQERINEPDAGASDSEHIVRTCCDKLNSVSLHRSSSMIIMIVRNNMQTQ